MSPNDNCRMQMVKVTLYPSRSHLELYPDLSVYQVFACIQQTIWRFHYQNVYQQQPFLAEQILFYIRRLLTTLGSEQDIHLII